MTRNDFSAYLNGLQPGDLSVAAAVQVLLRRADDAGVLRRGDWLQGVEARLAQVAEDLTGSAHGGPLDHEAVTQLMDDRILPELDRAGVVRPDAPGAGWSAVRLADALIPTDSADREALAAQVGGVIHTLEGIRASRFSVPDAGASALEDGSRLNGRGLTKVYKRRRVVNEVDISVSQGEIVGLLGPNGAGKTTTFYMMVGLIPPDGGSVHLDDEDLTDTPMYRRARKGVGYLAQEPSVFRKLTVEENVLAILETLKLPRKEEAARLDQLLAELGLAGLRESKAYSLSGGERRRLEITRALVQRPKFMLLDEPFAGIDPIAVNDIQQIVRGLKSRGIGVIISDHNVEQTLEIVDRAYIMYEGRIRVSGSVSELVWNEEAADIYLGPTLTARMRQRFPKPALP